MTNRNSRSDSDRMEHDHPQCASCPFPLEERLCRNEQGLAPAGCPTRDSEIVEEVRRRYGQAELAEFARQASIQEAQGYQGRCPGNLSPRPFKPRLLEIAEFAEKMGYGRLGLVFCVGLAREARKVADFLSERGFEVVSVICKAGRIPKEELGVRDDQKIVPGSPEAMCNPLLQAITLNRFRTEFNIVMGLCVGHDSIFLKNSDAYCTVLAAKDRPTGHNPLAAVYTLDSYYRHIREEE